MEKKAEDMAETTARVAAALRVALLGSRTRDVARALRKLVCFVRAACVCDTCPSWPEDVPVGYEWARWLVPTRAMQLLKERHAPSPRWAHLRQPYSELHTALYEDISPDTPLFSSAADDPGVRGSLRPPLDPDLDAAALEAISTELNVRVKRLVARSRE